MYYVRMDVNGDGSWEWAYYPSDEDCAAWGMTLKLAMNDPGTFEMTLPRTNPMHGRAVTRRTIVEVLRDGDSLFLGEVRDISHDADMSESIYAVGALAWLCNSTQGQQQFKRISVREFLSYMLAEHNKQCPEHPFTLGMVTIAEPDPDSETLLRYTNYGTTWATIKDRLITRFDETAVRLRRSGATWILDYVNVSDYGVECEQDVRFGENLLDYSDSLTSDDVCSSLIPLGAVINDENGNPSRLGNIIEKRVTIEKVNGGRNYIESPELVQRFGHVRVTHKWDGVNTPATLLRKGREWLQDGQWERLSLKVDMVDLAITGEAADAFRMGDRAYVVSEPYGLRKVFPIRSRTYNLDNPEQDSMTLGADVSTSFVSSIVNSAASSELADEDSDYIMSDALRTAIERVTAMMTGDAGGYKLSEYDDQGRWLADYIMDSMDKATAKVVRKVNLYGTAYSRNGVGGPYDTAIMADGTILGKYIQARSISGDKISADYTKSWQDADTRTLTTARTEFKAADQQIMQRVTEVKTDVNGVKTQLQAEVKVRADQISQTVRKGQINSAINQSAEKIYIKSNKFGWESTYSTLTTEGKLIARDFEASGKFKAANGADSVELTTAALVAAKNGAEKGRIGLAPALRVYNTNGSYSLNNNGLDVQGTDYVVMMAPAIYTGVRTISGGAYKVCRGYTGNLHIEHATPSGFLYGRLSFVNGLLVDTNYSNLPTNVAPEFWK